jgi:hypothetical protein
MATIIKFAGADNGITVVQTVDEVRTAMDGAGGEPFPLNLESSGEPVYVNPATLACWHQLELTVSPGRMVQDLGPGLGR